MEQTKTAEKTTRTGFVAADAKTTEFDSGKKVTNVTILSGSDENKKATYIKGWNAMADRLKDIKKGQKWEFKGSLAVETKDEKEYDVLTAKEAHPHIKHEIRGEVKHIRDKELTNTKMKNIMVVCSEMNGGKEVDEVYNIELYGDKNIKKADGIEVGDIVSTFGYARHYEYVKDGEAKVNKAFQNPLEIENHSAAEKKKGAEVTAQAGKAKKTGSGIDL